VARVATTDFLIVRVDSKNDVGTQYRSVILYHGEEQKKLADAYKKQLNEAKAFPQPIITEIAAFSTFYPAENYHQNFYNHNSRQPYCTFVIEPKLEKLKKAFPSLITNSTV